MSANIAAVSLRHANSTYRRIARKKVSRTARDEVELRDDFLTLNELQSSSRPVLSISITRLFVVIESRKYELEQRMRRTFAFRGDPTRDSPDPGREASSTLSQESKFVPNGSLFLLFPSPLGIPCSFRESSRRWNRPFCEPTSNSPSGIPLTVRRDARVRRGGLTLVLEGTRCLEELTQ